VEFEIERISPEVWKTVSEITHYDVFKTYKDKEWDRIDYALFALRKGESDPVAYMTCRELSRDGIYWQYGGSFKEIRGTTTSWRVYKSFIAWSKERYKSISTLTSNQNAVYLKMMAKAGFKIIGTKNIMGEVFLDHILTFEESAYV